MGTCSGSETEITTGVWGGPGGKQWSFKARHGIKQIIIRSGGVIDSIKFQGYADDASTANYSKKFGGDGGDRTQKVEIDFPSEYLTGISGTYEVLGNIPVVLRSLKFQTNVAQYGPFGTKSGIPFSFCAAEGGVITGFHGRCGGYLDAIGVILQPLSSAFVPVHIKGSYEVAMPNCASRSVAMKSAGPWGGDGRKDWDDGVFLGIRRVLVYGCSHRNLISAVRFEHLKGDETTVWSQWHGTSSGDIAKQILIDGKTEFLTGIEGFYGCLEEDKVIKSLTFYTNKGKYGPFGCEMGTYFISMVSNGKILGFHGRSGSYLNAVGVHTEYL